MPPELPIPIIRTLASKASFRHRLSPEESDDFGSEVMLKLVENDYAVLRKFSGKGSLKAYLAVVINRLLLDYRRKLWGKWRPSAEALRLGPEALRLEELCNRDGYSLGEAVRILRDRFDFSESSEQLELIWARLPARHSRRTDDLERYVDPPAPPGDPEADALERERTQRLSEIYGFIAQFRSQLPAEDDAVLSLRFDSGMTVAQISRALQLEQRPLYRRIEVLLRDLKHELTKQGVDPLLLGRLLQESYSSPAHEGKLLRRDVSEGGART